MSSFLPIYADVPCKGCEKRSPGCHGSCPEYKRFREEHDKAKAMKKIVSDSGRASHWWKNIHTKF